MKTPTKKMTAIAKTTTAATLVKSFWLRLTALPLLSAIAATTVRSAEEFAEMFAETFAETVPNTYLTNYNLTSVEVKNREAFPEQKMFN